MRLKERHNFGTGSVPVGDGFLPLCELTHRLLSKGLRRFTFENVWAYSAPIQKGRRSLNGVCLGVGAFECLSPPFDPAQVVLQQSAFRPEKLVNFESAALRRGHEAFLSVLKNFGATGDWNLY
jgi:3-oxoisoapionate decarboxylase